MPDHQISTWVVNLPRRTDRRAQIEAILPADLPATFTADLAHTFDGHRLNRDELVRRGIGCFPWRIDSDNPWWNRPLKLGEIGCTLAHLACWEHAYQQRATWTLILEDDAQFDAQFHQHLRHVLELVSTDFDFVYLGRYPLEPDQPAALPGFVHPGYSHCSFAYLLSQTALRCALDARIDQAIVPIDEFLPTLYLDHPRCDLRARFPNQKLRTLACEPPLVRQRPKSQAGSDTENSPFLDFSCP